MKKEFILSYALLFLVLTLPQGVEEVTPPPSPAPPSVTPSPSPAPSLPPEICEEDISVLFPDGEVRSLAMSDYLYCVVASEMPAQFEEEALCAQAVAARSYALCGQPKHAPARVCTDYHCCQAYSSPEELSARWGEEAEKNAARIRAAVEKTKGQVLVWNGEIIFAAFHSSSAGRTEASGEIWNPFPYLISVESPETSENVPNFVTAVQSSPLDFRDTVLSKHPEADFTGEEDTWLGAITRDESGRVRSVQLGGVELSGTELRSLFSLRSTAFTLEYTQGVFFFTVTGYGHGVGMSQYGANLMAQQGKSYAEILSHYYPSTELVQTEGGG